MREGYRKRPTIEELIPSNFYGQSFLCKRENDLTPSEKKIIFLRKRIEEALKKWKEYGDKEAEQEAFDLYLQYEEITSKEERKADQEIEINFNKTIEEQKEFYKSKLGIEINESVVREIWKKNYTEIKGEIEKYNYDSILIIPDNLPKEECLNSKLIETMSECAGKGNVAATYYRLVGDQQNISSVPESKYKIILVHSSQNLADHPLLKATTWKDIMALTGMDQAEVKSRISKGQDLPVDFEVKISGQKIKIKAESLSLEECEILQRMYFEENHKHFGENDWTWLMKSFSGSGVVLSGWYSDARRLHVTANTPSYARYYLGLRLSRSFSN
ncbi:hypothetical protein A2316_01615 [Candidatus Falkowbacteria bacterium RIFOXYB2_FULL_38_15]|uniref:Uncharacterized protein n=1 Tax=Candidatus Falkowbacteria bacterium RIFOXYA2_FULL_38_12 TaxID=1797993 RepID=A0A1F5S1E5_9BACT|nr:MAG: hypothetical protein A2257_04045 [Candidatus Falkowbacteria bacterium RIFOXYA2_FULL_38_12]OGF32934.1 MAG: hypothetical protein A2316_01615 [Candidatus Falkowbacteria bacterium RIFOXYB2_FULL_38_15]OGF44112.1 MAG: hypothetical protein A2555_01845 [Candidatus Falkowbacteria bacterium RIFOXYD2_FULL_39_16]